ncbi:2-C-methyl-D-erythritol 2,4-cyclodiphosphate synthase [Methylonatrum kenyense]|uniref:2-C-methyl-D-erythritol 2,4-cyclodiphosphate synthase n=1 Tax=Methylonatrum kenyense TaxID=455253 RepID=UPI0020C079EB|nr:2-C-methyl-D-erythritol 2,4-cyclodiphosphate synthase [Methylonatrum kenyense]MCK8516401.1 2-C-methyl-D-erythritol 2,4-cyclodiphosphate synthase [Methylonatrum kenyense]
MFRIGQGIDVHAFAAGRRLLLGGVEIPHSQGLAAHSDGDVILHALCDALLGAAALGDIGQHFPDSSADWKDADSRDLLRRVQTIVTGHGLQLVNADITVVAQQPKLAPWIPQMRECIAADLQVESGCISVKATTSEWLGFTGREEGILASAVVLLQSPDGG